MSVSWDQWVTEPMSGRTLDKPFSERNGTTFVRMVCFYGAWRIWVFMGFF